MKSRSIRASTSEQLQSSRSKSESSNSNGSNLAQRNQNQSGNQQTPSRKRRTSINVYDQPSSINLRLRQLETDMIRLDEDRTKLYDETHSALSQYELKLSEIHAILKSRQDNVEKYVEDMKLLIQAKEEFEKQTKQLTDKHDRIHEKFTHRETVISREIKLLKNKFELLEKNRQFRSILQKTNNNSTSVEQTDDIISGIDSSEYSNRTKSEQLSETDTSRADKYQSGQQNKGKSSRNVRIKLSKLQSLGKLVAPLFQMHKSKRLRRKSNKVSATPQGEETQIQVLQNGDITNCDSVVQEPQLEVPVTDNNNDDKPVVTKSKSIWIIRRFFR